MYDFYNSSTFILHQKLIVASGLCDFCTCKIEFAFIEYICHLQNLCFIFPMNPFIKIDFSQSSIKQRVENDVREVFDPARKIWVTLTPEEWVRQNFLNYLLSRKYPLTLLAVEKKIMVGELTKRCDIVVYSRNMNPFMIIECKRMDVELSQSVLEQVLRYHIPLQPPYLVITNGSFTMGFRKENGQFLPIDHFPEFGESIY